MRRLSRRERTAIERRISSRRKPPRSDDQGSPSHRSPKKVILAAIVAVALVGGGSAGAILVARGRSAASSDRLLQSASPTLSASLPSAPPTMRWPKVEKENLAKALSSEPASACAARMIERRYTGDEWNTYMPSRQRVVQTAVLKCLGVPPMSEGCPLTFGADGAANPLFCQSPNWYPGQGAEPQGPPNPRAVWAYRKAIEPLIALGPDGTPCQAQRLLFSKVWRATGTNPITAEVFALAYYIEHWNGGVTPSNVFQVLEGSLNFCGPSHPTAILTAHTPYQIRLLLTNPSSQTALMKVEVCFDMPCESGPGYPLGFADSRIDVAPDGTRVFSRTYSEKPMLLTVWWGSHVVLSKCIGSIGCG